MDALLGLTSKDWLRLLKENRFKIDRKYLGRAIYVTLMSFQNSIGKRKEDEAYGGLIQNVRIKQPVFILGHWRSGTTLLHELMVQDDQFAYPNLFQVSHPNTCLIREALVDRAMRDAESEKRHMDNVQLTYESPGEDEAALAVMSLRSPLIGWSFPKQEEFYDQFLTFEGVNGEDLEAWKNSLVTFLKKLTWRYERTLLLKSPTHTARIKLLLELFPDAKFIHIGRDPYTVFRSTRNLYKKAAPNSYLQTPVNGLDEGIFKRYKIMYDAFFRERSLIPAGNYCEIFFEDLEKDKIGQVEKIYDTLSLPGFDTFKPKLEQYLSSIKDYKKNKYQPLPDDLKKRILENWKRNFEEWGYSN